MYVLDALARDRAGGDDWRTGGNFLDLEADAPDRLGKVRLGQNDRRRGAALPGHGQVALDAPDVHVVSGSDDERHVDIGGEDLLTRLPVHDLARERCAPLDDAVDDRRGVPSAWKHSDPVTD